MPWAQLHWRSDVLGKQTTMQVILPTAGSAPYPPLYLLHGLSDDSTIWLRRSRIEAYVRELPIIVVMPDGYRGFYTDNDSGPAYACHIGEEIPYFIERTFPARAARGSRAIGGLSMGGYGALRVALGYPERFCSANSHSGAVMRLNLNRGWRSLRKDPVFRDRPAAFFEELRRIFGRHPMGTAHDLLFLVRRARRRGHRLPRILLDCGTEDSLLPCNRDLHRDLEAAGVGHEYREHPGGHEWDYWDLHVREALAFHARNLRLPEAPAP